MPINRAAWLSFANIFLFLPNKREIMMTDKMVQCLSNTTQAVSAAQSLLGVVLLFLLGLALRNRFRMK
jgi:Ca2+/H+ antiporter